jgi:CheY-like chemotaxis protein
MARILILDDEEDMRESLRRALERSGHDVLAAAGGREGLKIHRATPADLVITDILMPELDGIEVLKQMLCDSPDLKVIAISGGSVRVQIDLLKIAEILGAATSVILSKTSQAYELGPGFWDAPFCTTARTLRAKSSPV